MFSLVYGAAKLHVQHLTLLNLTDPTELRRFMQGLASFALAALRAGT